MRTRTDLHLARRLYHTLGLILILIIFHNVDRSTALRLLAAATLILVPVDAYRLKNERFNRFVISLGRPLMRVCEEKNLSAMSYLLCGVFLCIAIFPKNIATLSLFLLAFGDPAASIVGTRWGKDKILGPKSLQGTLAAFVICTLVSFIFFQSRELMLPRVALASILAGLIGAIAELIPLGKLDDNFSFPIVSSTLLWFLFFVLGGFAGPSL